jgi:hypothetical protein
MHKNGAVGYYGGGYGYHRYAWYRGRYGYRRYGWYGRRHWRAFG